MVVVGRRGQGGEAGGSKTEQATMTDANPCGQFASAGQGLLLFVVVVVVLRKKTQLLMNLLLARVP